MNSPISSPPDLRQTDAPARSYVVAGSGTPVVMLHASLASKAQWAPLIERLARRFRAIAIDLCGYGDNAPVATAPPFTLDAELADRRVRWRDAGHMGPVTDPDRVNPWIEAFVDARIAYDRLQTAVDSPRIEDAAAKATSAIPGSKERHDEHYQVL